LSATEDGRKAAALRGSAQAGKSEAGVKALENPAASAVKSYVKQLPEDTAVTNVSLQNLKSSAGDRNSPQRRRSGTASKLIAASN
jgi:hypothetical protein